MNEPAITFTGNLTGPVELRFTNTGTPVANFTVASTPRSYNAQTREWVDGETVFLRCQAWKALGENIAETLDKGMRVIVSGRLRSRSYQTKTGEQRTQFEVEVDDIGPSLMFAQAQVRRAGKTQPADDPWANPNEEAPF